MGLGGHKPFCHLSGGGGQKKYLVRLGEGCKNFANSIENVPDAPHLIINDSSLTEIQPNIYSPHC